MTHHINMVACGNGERGGKTGHTSRSTVGTHTSVHTHAPVWWSPPACPGALGCHTAAHGMRAVPCQQSPRPPVTLQMQKSTSGVPCLNPTQPNPTQTSGTLQGEPFLLVFLEAIFLSFNTAPYPLHGAVPCPPYQQFFQTRPRARPPDLCSQTDNSHSSGTTPVQSGTRRWQTAAITLAPCVACTEPNPGPRRAGQRCSGRRLPSGTQSTCAESGRSGRAAVRGSGCAQPPGARPPP